MIIVIIAANNKMPTQVGIGFLLTVSMVLFVKWLQLANTLLGPDSGGGKFDLSPEDRQIGYETLNSLKIAERNIHNRTSKKTLPTRQKFS